MKMKKLMINNLFGFYLIRSPKSNVGKKNTSLIVPEKETRRGTGGRERACRIHHSEEKAKDVTDRQTERQRERIESGRGRTQTQ